MINTSLIYDVFQYALVGVLVAGCATYCVLALAPNEIKIPLRGALLRLPLPALFRAKLSQNRTSGACGSTCGGCSAPPPATPPAKKIHWHPRQR